MGSGGASVRCAALAAGQHGLITRHQALRCGLTAQMIAGRVRNAGWTRIHPNVYLLPGLPLSWEGRVFAAFLSVNGPCLVSHRSAARLYQLEDRADDAVDLSVWSGISRNGVDVHRLSRSDQPKSRSVRGLRVTGVERTLLDVCTVTAPKRAGRSMDAALRARLTSIDRLARYADDIPEGRYGRPVFTQLIRIRDRRDEALGSEIEARMARILRTLPYRWQPQFPIDTGSHNYRVDFAIPDAMLAIECHSIKWHFGEEAFKKDLAHDRRLTLIGWTVLYYSWDEIVLAPDEVKQDVVAATKLKSSRKSAS